MFFKKKKEKKKKGMFDKVVMGTIVGTAIGSVVGMAVAPKSGKQTRKDIKNAKDKFMMEHGGEIDEIKEEAKEKSKRAVNKIKKRFFRR